MSDFEGWAHEVYERLFRVGKHRKAPIPIDPLGIIRTALRQVETETIERAAKVAEGCNVARPNWGTREEIARRIRNLHTGEG